MQRGLSFLRWTLCLGACGLVWSAGAQSASDFADELSHAESPRVDDETVSGPTNRRVQVAEAKGPCAENAGKDLDSTLWVERKIESLQVVNALGNPPDPKPVPANASKFPDADLVLNGAFHARDGAGRPTRVAGATMRNGVLDAGVAGFSLSKRGGVARLSDGRIVICKPDMGESTVTEEAIQKNCGEGGAKVVDFMGGAAYLVRNGFKACSDSAIAAPCDDKIDLAKDQGFLQAGRGIRATQMHSALHAVVAMKKGSAYVVFSKRPVTGAKIQSELCAAGFDEVVMYDGGSGYIAWGPKSPHRVVGVNPTAFVIKTAP